MILHEKVRRKITIEEEIFTEVNCDFCGKKFDIDENNFGDWIELEFRYPDDKEYIGEICQNCFNKLFKKKLRFINRYDEFDKPDYVDIVESEKKEDIERQRRKLVKIVEDEKKEE